MKEAAFKINKNKEINNYSRADQEILKEMMSKFGPASIQVSEYIRLLEEEKDKKKMGIKGENVIEFKNGQLIQRIEKALKIIDDIQLEQANGNHEKILQKEKNTARDLISKCLKSANIYAKSVFDLQGAVAHKIDTRVYQEKVQSSDQRRRQAHEALISDINIALRYINEHFSRYGEDALDELEEKFEKRNEIFLKVNRVKFPTNIFLPELISVKNRKDIGNWAVSISEELAKYRQKLL